MKTFAILLMLLTIVIMAGYGLFYLLGFAMSFDAPGSDKDPKAWGMRIMILFPIFIFLAMLILAWQAYYAGNYNRSVLLGAVTPVMGAILFGYLMVSSMSSMREYRNQLAKEKELEAKYPVEKYTRQTSLGTDTIIVWPTGIVAYRLHVEGMTNTWNGPLGDLSADRKTITYNHSTDTRLQQEELHQFVDESGRKFSELYLVK